MSVAMARGRIGFRWRREHPCQRQKGVQVMVHACRSAQSEDFPAIEQMLELYQYELSDIWDQDLDEHGRFGYELGRHRDGTRFFAHVLTVDGRYAGFALVAPAVVTRSEGFWMEQFFILKKYRRGGLGSALARHVFDSHPGPWELGQMPLNVPAQAFWRKVIGALTGGRFTEVEVTEGWWQGVVQRFEWPGPQAASLA
jgi:predicted acetyltransferase